MVVLRCNKCGALINQDDKFCSVCGAVVDNNDLGNNDKTNFSSYAETERIMNNLRSCPYCGSLQDADAEFCMRCGKQMRNSVSASNNKKYITIIIVLSVLFIGSISCILAYLFYTSNSETNAEIDDKTISSPYVVATTQTPTPAPTPTATPVPTPVVRTVEPIDTVYRESLYSSSATYKRMPEIHYSTRSSDSEFLELRSVIIDFDYRCEAYLNYGNNSIFEYLKPGTTAYNQQTEYKANHPNRKQSYVNITVHDVRDYNSYYYVWVTEYTSIEENGKYNSAVDRWVYKVRRTENGWSIDDYTKNPV